MTFREINYLKLEEYVESAWEGDKGLENFYDPNLKNRSLREMVFDTTNKIKDYFYYNEKLKIYGIDEHSTPCGFVVLSNSNSMLYSFGINHRMRNAENLQYLFNFIRKNLNECFYTLLYEKNERAINWLKKCGMREVKELKPDEGIVYLSY